MNKVLVRHLHDIKGKLFATIAAIGPDMVGVSIVNECDEGSKNMGEILAIGRAYKGEIEKVPNREVLVGNLNFGLVKLTHIQDVINDEVQIMRNRSFRSFTR